MVTATAKRRIVALEDAHGEDKCPACGFGRNEHPPWKVRIVGSGDPREPDRWCPECGGKLIHNMTWRWE